MNPAVRQLLLSGRALREQSFLRVATFGDSTADAKSAYATTNYLDQSVGDRQINGTSQVGTFVTSKWLLPRYYPAAQLCFNGGIGGQSTTAMLARSGGAAGPTRRAIEDVLAAAPDLIIARCGSINDMTAWTAATPQSSIDGVFDRHMQIISQLASGGAYVIDEGIAGFDASGGIAPSAPDLAFIRAALISLNERFAAAISGGGNRRVKFLSPVGLTCDATGAFLSNRTTTGDGTHLTNYAQTLVAQAEKALIDSWIGPSTTRAYPGANLIATEAAYPSPTTVAFGTVPNTTNFSWTVTAGTRQNATVAAINGVNYASCELLGTSTGPFLVFTANLLPLLITPGLVSAGDVVSVEADFIAEAVSGTLGPNAVASRVQFGISSTDRIIYDMTTGLAPSTGVETSLSGRLSFGKLRIPTDIASLTSANTLMYVRLDGVNGSTCRLSVGNIRIVKLN